MLVRDLVALLANVDPDLDVRITMNMEYDGDVGSVYILDGSLYFDDIPASDAYDIGDTMLYTA